MRDKSNLSIDLINKEYQQITYQQIEEKTCKKIYKYSLQVLKLYNQLFPTDKLIPFSILIPKVARNLFIDIAPQIHENKIMNYSLITSYEWSTKFNIIWSENAAIKIQNFWRNVLAKRKLQRLKIKREIEHIPNIGIKYFKYKKHFENLILL